MLPVKLSFLHFFDIHYLEEKGISNLHGQIFKEANLATRFSLLSADVTLVPAAVYIESEICKRILDSFNSLIPYGIIRLIGKAYSFREFCERKIIQYANRPAHQKLYIDALSGGIEFPFYKRTRSSTKDIVSDWIFMLNEGDAGKDFYEYDEFARSDEFEKKWESIPELLGNSAFIVPNIISQLLPNCSSNLSVKNHLHAIVNKSYFRSYINELNASIITDLSILDSNYTIENNNIVNIPYKYILQELNVRKKVENIARLHPDDLMIYRGSDNWNDVFCSAYQKKQNFVEDRQIFYSLGREVSSTTINIFNGGINMGDTYNANQVGGQGRYVNAHDMTFNQIWQQKSNDIDLDLLSKELCQLRLKLSELAETPENHKDVGLIATAEIEANNKNGPNTLQALSKAGKWTLGIAEKIGVGLVVSVLKDLL